MMSTSIWTISRRDGQRLDHFWICQLWWHNTRPPSPPENWQMPVLPPVCSYAAAAAVWVQFSQLPTVVYSASTQTELELAVVAVWSPTVVDVGVRALTRPPLAPPPVPMSDIVRVVGNGLHIYPTASPEFLTNVAVRDLGVRLEQNQHSAIQLAITFGVVAPPCFRTIANGHVCTLRTPRPCSAFGPCCFPCRPRAFAYTASCGCIDELLASGLSG